MEHQGQLFKDPKMISKKSILLAEALLFLTLTVEAAPEISCRSVEQSAAQSKGIAYENSVLVAISANDVKDSNLRNPIKDAKRMLQMMFINYCKEFSGYKHFQVTTSAGISRAIKCNGNLYYAYSVEKSNITITQLNPSDLAPTAVIPELADQKDVFEEFK